MTTRHLCIVLFVALLLAACAPLAPTPESLPPTAAPVQPTATTTPGQTPTVGPAAAPPTTAKPTAVPPTAAPGPVVRRIEFQPGTSKAVVTGRVPAGGSDAWVLYALAGQQMTVNLNPTGGQAILVIFGADGTVLLSDHAGATTFRGVLPFTEDYNIHVRNVGAAAVNYSLEVSIPAMPQPTPVVGPTPVTQRIQFAPGGSSASYPGRVGANSLDRYVLRILGGQTLIVRLQQSGGQAVLVIWGADGTVLISDHAGATNWSGQVPSTQDYFIDVRNDSSVGVSYTLQVSVPPTPQPTQVVQPTPVARRIQFAPGADTATVNGQVAPTASDAWVLRAGAGQTLKVRLMVVSGQAGLIIWGADGTVLKSEGAAASEWEGPLPKTQDYTIRVHNNGAGNLSYGLTVTVPPIAQPEPAAQRISFPPGADTATVNGQVAPTASDAWVLAAGAGQTLKVRLMVVSGQAGLIIWGADGTVLKSEGAAASEWEGQLPRTQDYTIRVHNNGAGNLSYGLTVTIPPIAQPEPAAQRISFPPGGITATVRGQLAANGAARWIVGASANQRMTASLAMTGGQAILLVWGADGTVLQTDHAGSSSFEGQLPKTQDYTLDVRCVSAAACNYALTVTIPPAR